MQQAEYKDNKQKIDKTVKQSKPSKKKRMSKGTRILLIIVCIFVAIALLLVATVLILDHIGHKAMTADGSGMRAPEQAEIVEAGRVRYNGQLYQFKNDITTVLFMGVDSKEKAASSGEFGGSNQADVVVLGVLDPGANQITLISISRDSMCEIELLDGNGNRTATARAQLALSYAYGDGADVSCQLTADAVSKLFYDLPISAYASIYMNGVGKLADIVGGVEVMPKESFGQFRAGESVIINSSNAEAYLRYRDKTVDGNNARMERQKGVILALAKSMLAELRTDPTSILSIYNGVSKNVTTNLNAASMVYLARVASGMKLDTDVHKVAGESILGAENHAEFIVDEIALYELILEIFYEPIDG